MNRNEQGGGQPMSFEDYLALGLYSWFPTFKKDYRIQAKMVSDDTEVYNFLEDIHYIARRDADVVLRGSLGEEYVNNLSAVAATYTNLDGSEITIRDFSVRDKYIDIKTIVKRGYFAYPVPVKYKVDVRMAGGGLLHANREGVAHGRGDYLVCKADKDGSPDLSNVWSVNGLQFEANYDMTNCG